jgi:hypothetical protein
VRSVSVAYNATLGVLAKEVQLARGATARHPVNPAILVQAAAAVFVNEGQGSLQYKNITFSVILQKFLCNVVKFAQFRRFCFSR